MAQKKTTAVSKPKKKHLSFQRYLPMQWLLPLLIILFLFPLLYVQYATDTHTPPHTSSQLTISPVFTPSPFLTNTSSGWKHYKNDYYELSFPSTYSFSNESGTGKDAFTTVGIVSPPNPNRGIGYELKNGELKIEVHFEPYRKTLDTYISGIRVGVDAAPGTTFQKTRLHGFPSVYSVSHYSSGAEVYYLVHNGYIFSIAKFPLVTTPAREKDYTDILASFRFVD